MSVMRLNTPAMCPLYVLLALCAAASTLAATLEPRPSPSTPQVKRGARSAVALRPFEGSYDEALARAIERNVPLLALAIAEENGKELDDDIRQFRDALFNVAALATASEMSVLLLTSNGVHPPKSIEVQEGETKTTRQVCSVYRTSSCQAHQKQFDRVYAEHNVEGELKNPSVFLVGVDRKVARAWNTGNVPDWSAVAAAQTELQKKLGEGLSEAQFAEVSILMPQGTGAERNRQWADAFTTWGKVLAITRGSKYAVQARAGQGRALEELDKSLAAARAGLEQEGQAVESYKTLLALQREWSGTVRDKDLAREVLAAEKHKLAKDAIAAYKRELEAETLWRQAEELLGAGNEKGAQAKLRTILRKFPGSAADKRVRQRFPELAADEDAKKSDS